MFLKDDYDKNTTMIHDKTLNEIVEIIKKELNPSKIYLFGSRARGDHHKDSDYDILIIVDHLSKRRYDVLGDLYMATFDVPYRIDFHLFTQNEFNEWKDEFGAVPYDCAREGILLNV